MATADESELPDLYAEDRCAEEPRCPGCGVVLGDVGLVTLGYCSSECERNTDD